MRFLLLLWTYSGLRDFASVPSCWGSVLPDHHVEETQRVENVRDSYKHMNLTGLLIFVKNEFPSIVVIFLITMIITMTKYLAESS